MIAHAIDIGTNFGGIEGTFADIVSLVLNIIFVVAGVTVLFLFLFGGFKTISAAGNSDPRSAAQGKEAISAAVVGFLIVFSSYWIVRLLEVMLGVDFITNLSF